MKAAARGQKLKLYFYNVYTSGAASIVAPLRALENQCSPNPGSDNLSERQERQVVIDRLQESKVLITKM